MHRTSDEDRPRRRVLGLPFVVRPTVEPRTGWASRHATRTIRGKNVVFHEQAAISILSRPKLNSPFFEHYGVLVRQAHLGHADVVIDLRQDGVRAVTPAEFAAGHAVKIESVSADREVTHARLLQLIDRGPGWWPWFNCESAAREVATGTASSGQAQLVGLAAFLLLALREA